MAKDTMQAAVFLGPHQVEIQQRPIPKIQEPTDIIVKVGYTALCGSELHVFRGHQKSAPGFIMGHEWTGAVTEVGDAVRTVKKGDIVVAAFTTSCGECFYCKRGFSSRCEKSQLFGSPALDGGQAEYVRAPLADTSVRRAPPGIDPKYLVLMADIFPTGYFAASNALSHLTEEEIKDSTVVVIGCGPVGLCAVLNAAEYAPKHLLAVDGTESRLKLAEGLGAEGFNHHTQIGDLDKKVREYTNGRGADVVIEVVGLSSALRTSFDILRPWGIISSVGLHNAEVPWTGREAYDKNLKIQTGRCPVGSIFNEAFEKLEKNQHKLGFMADKIMPLSEAMEGYEIFDHGKAQKVIFEAEN
ncbi:GroES-like protein [Rhizodiscina lignyota]|uniref:GroES-like protein n=1 Tax=Rhizodiscina lignyota TaxID=1504668 RepID=A0A9P4IMC1_9PEZI|nr:GroES-like protein [Rhizodiscina lignyota]